MQKPKAKCGAESTLCSNACALTYAKQRGGTRCAICSYDKKTGRVGRHDTTKISAECRSHTENAGWTHKKQEEADELIETRVDELDRLREQQDTPLMP